MSLYFENNLRLLSFFLGSVLNARNKNQSVLMSHFPRIQFLKQSHDNNFKVVLQEHKWK